MAWSVAYACDICGTGKGEANHWWMASLTEPAESGHFTLMRWTAGQSPGHSQGEDVYHLCGQRCVLQAIERFMTEGAIDAR